MLLVSKRPNLSGWHSLDHCRLSFYKVPILMHGVASSAREIQHRLTAVVLAVLMAALGWFVRSEAAHDHLHVHSSAAQLAGASLAQFARDGRVVVTQKPRWLKVAAAPGEGSAPKPAGAHHHRSVAFDSLAAGQWCGLFTPAVLPLLDRPTVAVAAPLRHVPLPSPHWTLLPGRAPPACA